jgi:hypothetical protein
MKSTTMPSVDIIADSLISLGFVIFIIGGFWFLIAAFRESVLWGLACLFIPIVPLFFLIVHWPEAKRPFFLQLLAFVMIIAGFFLNPQALHRDPILSQPLRFGAASDATRTFDGWLDGPAIFTNALSAQTNSAHFNAVTTNNARYSSQITEAEPWAIGVGLCFHINLGVVRFRSPANTHAIYWHFD